MTGETQGPRRGMPRPPGEVVSVDDPQAEVFEDALEGIIEDPEQRERAAQALSMSLKLSMELSQSPYPPLAYMQGLEALVPSSAKHLIEQADAQTKHRHQLERSVVMGGEQRANRGQWMGFVVALAFLVVAAALILSGHEIAGTVLGTVDLIVLVALFAVGRQRQSKDESRRRSEEPQP